MVPWIEVDCKISALDIEHDFGRSWTEHFYELMFKQPDQRQQGRAVGMGISAPQRKGYSGTIFHIRGSKLYRHELNFECTICDKGFNGTPESLPVCQWDRKLLGDRLKSSFCSLWMVLAWTSENRNEELNENSVNEKIQNFTPKSLSNANFASIYCNDSGGCLPWTMLQIPLETEHRRTISCFLAWRQNLI